MVCEYYENCGLRNIPFGIGMVALYKSGFCNDAFTECPHRTTLIKIKELEGRLKIKEGTINLQELGLKMLG